MTALLQFVVEACVLLFFLYVVFCFCVWVTAHFLEAVAGMREEIRENKREKDTTP